MNSGEVWEKSVYNVFLDLLKSKKQKFMNIFDWDKTQRENPFGVRLINNQIFWKSAKIERSFVTTLGQSTYEEIARIISKETYGKAIKGHTYYSKINQKINQEINVIIKELNEGKRSPNWNEEIVRLNKLKTSASKVLIKLKITMDLYIPRFKNNIPFYAEIKSPKPNKDQCLQTKQKLLKVYFSEDWEGDYVFFAFPYNPYSSRNNYDHPHIKSVFKIPDSPKLLMGQEFWNFIGGNGCYLKLLELAKKAGEKINLLS